jgi:hypothetical protein
MHRNLDKKNRRLHGPDHMNKMKKKKMFVYFFIFFVYEKMKKKEGNYPFYANRRVYKSK